MTLQATNVNYWLACPMATMVLMVPPTIKDRRDRKPQPTIVPKGRRQFSIFPFESFGISPELPT